MNARSMSIAIALLAGPGVGQQVFAQGINNFFLMGYESYGGLPWGSTNMMVR